MKDVIHILLIAYFNQVFIFKKKCNFPDNYDRINPLIFVF